MTDPKPAPAPAPRGVAVPAPAPAPVAAPFPVVQTSENGSEDALLISPRPAPPVQTPHTPDQSLLADESANELSPPNAETAAGTQHRTRRIPGHLQAAPHDDLAGIAVAPSLPPKPSASSEEEPLNLVQGDVHEHDTFQLSDLEPPQESIVGEVLPNEKRRFPFRKTTWGTQRSDRTQEELSTSELLSEHRPARKVRPALFDFKFPRKGLKDVQDSTRSPDLFRTPAGRAGLIALGGALVLLPASFLLSRKSDTPPPIIGAPSVGAHAATTVPPVVPANNATPIPEAKQPTAQSSTSPQTAQSAALPKANHTVNATAAAPNIAPNKAAAIKTVDSKIASNKATAPQADPSTRADVRQALVAPDPALASTFRPQGNGAATNAQTGGVLPAQIKSVAVSPEPVRVTAATSSAAPRQTVTPQPAPAPKPVSVSNSQITYAPPRYVTPPTGAAQPVPITAPTTVHVLPTPPSTVTLTGPVTLDENGPTTSTGTAPTPVVPRSASAAAQPSPVVVIPETVRATVSYLGYAKGEGGNVAVVLSGSTTDSVMVGGMIAGAHVTEITPSHITLKDKGGSRQIPLEVNQ